MPAMCKLLVEQSKKLENRISIRGGYMDGAAYEKAGIAVLASIRRCRSCAPRWPAASGAARAHRRRVQSIARAWPALSKASGNRRKGRVRRLARKRQLLDQSPARAAGSRLAVAGCRGKCRGHCRGDRTGFVRHRKLEMLTHEKESSWAKQLRPWGAVPEGAAGAGSGFRHDPAGIRRAGQGVRAVVRRLRRARRRCRRRRPPARPRPLPRRRPNSTSSSSTPARTSCRSSRSSASSPPSGSRKPRPSWTAPRRRSRKPSSRKKLQRSRPSSRKSAPRFN